MAGKRMNFTHTLPKLSTWLAPFMLILSLITP